MLVSVSYQRRAWGITNVLSCASNTLYGTGTCLHSSVVRTTWPIYHKEVLHAESEVVVRDAGGTYVHK